MFAAFLTTILFSISAVSAYRTTRHLGGIEANMWRILVATLFLGIWAHGFGQGLSGAAFTTFLLSGFVGFGIGDIALYQALPRLGSRLSILLVQCLAAPFAAMAEWLWLGNTLSIPEIICGLTILAGVSIALAPGRHLNLTRRVFVVGISFGVVAALGQGLGAVLSRKAYEIANQHGEHIDGITAAYQRILAGLAVAVVFWAILKHRRANTDPMQPREKTNVDWARVWPWVVVNGLAGPALGVSCYQWALSSTPTGIVLPIVAITPLVVIPFSRYMEGERPSRRSFLGGLIAVAGAVALTRVAS